MPNARIRLSTVTKKLANSTVNVVFSLSLNLREVVYDEYRASVYQLSLWSVLLIRTDSHITVDVGLIVCVSIKQHVVAKRARKSSSAIPNTMKSTRLLVLVALLAWTHAVSCSNTSWVGVETGIPTVYFHVYFPGPINVRLGDESTSCARRCTASNKFKYVPGVTYEHDYHVTTETLMGGANGEKAVIQIHATADIEALTKCDFALRLRNVRLYDTSRGQLTFIDNVGRFRQTLERNPLRFSFQDGVIEDLCPSDDEEPWALNVKRGVLTVLQNSMDNTDQDQTTKETDVTGNCVTDYKVTDRGWYSTTVKKTKDLLSCTGRHGYQSAMHAVPYRVPSDIQSLPLIKSTHECEHKVAKDGFMTSALCRESHIFRPFSNQNSGAVTHVTQKLEFKQRNGRVTTDRNFIYSRVDMNFQHVTGHGHGDHQRNLDAKLNELCASSEHDIRPEVPRLFSDLVFVVRDVDSTVIRQTLMRVKKEQVCRGNIVRGRKFLLDAIPMAGTSSSVQVLKELLLSKDVTGVEADMWLTSLAFIQNPTRAMLEEVKPLVESPELKLKAMLPVSTLVNNYCERNHCGEEYAVDNIISSLERNIGYRCMVRDANLEVVLMTLRAIGNAGHLRRISSILSNCITESTNPMEVRIAAVEGFRRVPCDADRNDIIRLYQDTEEDSEIRIGAYLGLMVCPSEDTLNIITQTLTREKASQVGSFIWSHLTNLMESASPHKQSIKAILEKEDLKKEFDLEKLKYSRNYEGSLFFERLNTGAVVESNLIWSPKSFVPRSAMVNLTVDLFGNSINLFELGGRIEGLEYLLETYLGPYGYFGNKNMERTIAESREKLKQLRGSMYMRIFGNEMSYTHFKGIDSFTDGKRFNLLDTLIRMSKEHDYAFTQSVMFMDSTVIIPTSSGLPLNLTVNGTATVDLKAVGKMDLRKAAKSPRSLLVDGTIQPSGAIRFAGAMTVDAFITKTGMRIVNTWHSSTTVRGRIELDRGKILSAEIEAPKNKMEILDVKTGFFSIHGDVEREEKLLDNKRKTIKLCSGQRLAMLSGLETCAEFQYVNASYVEDAPYFPLTGPLSFELTLETRDTHSVYKLLAKRTESKSSSVAQLAFDTPGSKVQRALSFDISMNHKQKQLDIIFLTPWKEASLQGKITNDRDLKKIAGVLIIDQTRRYSMISELSIKKMKNGYAYIPRIEFQHPGIQTVEMSGKIIIEKRSKIDVDLTLHGIRTNPLTIKSTIMNTDKESGVRLIVGLSDKEQYSVDAGLIHDQKQTSNSFKFVPTLKIQTPTSTPVSITGSLDYKEGKSLKGSGMVDIKKLMTKAIAMKGSLTMNSRGYYGGVNIKSKYLAVKVTGNVINKKDGTVSSKLAVDYDLPKHKNIRKNKITLSSKFKDKSTASLSKFLVNANMVVKKNPELNFQADLDMSHNPRKHTGMNIEVKYGKSVKDLKKVVTVSANVNHALKSKSSSVDYKVRVKHPAKGTNISWQGNHKHDSKSLVTSHKLNYGNGRQISTDLTLKDNSKKLKKLSGNFQVVYLGKKMSVNTDLTQPSSGKYKHTINGKYGKTKGSIVTEYTKGKDGSHTVSSDIMLPNVDHTRITGSTNLNRNDFKATGNVLYGKKEYGVKTSYKYLTGKQGKLALDVKYPSQKIEVELEGEKNDSEYSGRFDAKWDNKKRIQVTGSIDIPSINDVDSTLELKYPSQSIKFNMRHHKRDDYITHADVSWSKGKKIVLDTTFKSQESRGSNTKTAALSLKTPFKLVDDVAMELSAANDNGKYAVKSKVQWNGKRKEITSSIDVLKPVSARHLNLFVTASTPFENMRRLQFDVRHALTSKLNTEIKASMDRKNVKIVLSGENRNGAGKRDVEGLVSFESNIPKFPSVELQVKHVDDWTDYNTNVVVDIGGHKYVYDLELHHQNRGFQVINNGKLHVAAGSYYRLSNTWQHHNTDKTIKTVVNSDWGRGNRIRFDLSGNHDASDRMKTVGSLDLETPWTPLRSVNINLSNEFGSGYIAQQTHYVHDGVPKVSTNVNYIKMPDHTEADFSIATPWTEDISGKLNTRSKRYPMTGHAELQWSPYKKFTADGSLTAISLTNINGDLRITTPYQRVRSIFIRASQMKKGPEIITTAAVEYGTRKTIEFENRIQVENGIKIFSKVETPFASFKLIQAGYQLRGDVHDFDTKAEFTASPIIGTFKGALNWNYVSDLSGKLRIDTPYQRFPYFQLSIQNDESRNHFLAEAEYSPQQIIRVDAKYKFSGPIDIETTLKTPFTNAEYMSAGFKYTMGSQAIETSAKGKFGSYDPVQASLRLKWNEGIDGTVSIKTPMKEIKSSKLVIHHHGSITDFKSSCDFKLNKEKLLSVDAEFQDQQQTKGTLTIASSRFSDIRVEVMKYGNLENFKGFASLTYGDSQTVKATVQNTMSGRRLKSVVSIETPFAESIDMMVDYRGNLKNFTTKISGSLGRKYSIRNDFSFKTDTQLTEGSDVLSYKIADQTQDIGFSFHKDGTQDNWTAKMDGYIDNKHIKIGAHFTHDGNVDGKLKVQTPFDSFRDVGLSFNHAGTRNNFQSEGTVTYMDGKTIQGKAVIESASLKNLRGKVTATTPFDGYRQTSVEHSHQMSDNDIKINFKIELPNSPAIAADIHLTANGPDAQIVLAANTNIDMFRKVTFMVKKSGNVNQFNGEFKLITEDIVVKGDISHRNRRGNLSTKITLTNPFTERIDVSIQHSRRSNGFSTSAAASMGTETNAEVQTTFNQQNSDTFELTSNAGYKRDGYGNKAKLNIKKTGTLSNAEITMEGSINEKTITTRFSLQRENTIYSELSITTPFEQYRNIGFSFQYSGTINNFSSKGTLQYMENQTISVKVTHYHDSWQIINSKVEIKTPFDGFENLQGNYDHSSDSDKFSCDISVQYGQGRKIGGIIKASLIPRPEFEIEISTPYDGFRRWTANGHYEQIIKKYEASVQISGGTDKTIALQSSIDLSGSPYTASLNIQTPFKDFERNELTITHKGTPTNFDSTITLTIPIINTIRGVAHLRYKTPYTLDGAVSVTSSIPCMENLELALRASNESDQKKLHTELAWASGREIILDVSSRSHNDWNSKVLTFDVVMSTPFEIARHESLKFEQSIGSDTYAHKIEVEHNAETILDVDIDYSKYPRYEGSIAVKSPRPMQFTVSGRLEGKSFDGDLMLNWNKNEPNSNVRFETAYGDKEGQLDKDIKFKLIHPVRTMGITGSLKSTRRHTSSHAELSWNEEAGHKVSYDFSLKDKSRRYSNMYDSTVKIGIPGRSLQVTGSYGGNRKVRTVDGSFLWDADEDQNKAVGMKATFQPADSRADITFSLPSIGKDIKIGTEMSVNEGRTLFNSRTQFSYSQDSRKTLTFMSSLRDISTRYGAKNYSLTFGIAHPYTDLDCRMSSSVGQSTDRYSAGLDISYLTARREKKNLALRAEIDRLRNQMNFEIVSPHRRIEVFGDIVNTSPLLMRFRNRIDGRLLISSALTLDLEEKSLDFQTNYDPDHPEESIRISAKYVNSSAFRAEVFHAAAYEQHVDGLLAFRLNTSHLLHTRIHWRPEIVKEFEDYLIKKLEKYGKDIDTGAEGMMAAIAQELEARYRRTVTHVTKELEPVKELIDREMDIVGRQLEKFTRDLRRMYTRNDLYVRDMGNTAQIVINALDSLILRYKSLREQVDMELTKFADKLKSYPVREKYLSLIGDGMYNIQRAVSSGVTSTSEWISKLDEELQNWRNSLEHHSSKLQNSVSGYLESVKNHPVINGEVYSRYINTLSNKLTEGIKSTNLADQYNSVIYNVRELVNARLADVISREEMNHLHTMANNVYQEGVWAYNYWQVEENTMKHLMNIMTLMKEIIQEEFEKYTPFLQIFKKSKVTVYDPEHGEIQMEMYLPIPLQSLDTAPNVLPHITRAYNRYIPDGQTLQKYYNYLPTMFKGRSNDTNSNADFNTQMEQYLNSNQPTRPLRRPRYYAMPV
ncbi:uncharacterized protein LOC121374798 [Gigantopelta aegis]|uniref:uncharacterized protein LOC121374798 n=1 Tax=Gigantopelta aegis TaxID=1735272 RepID=UPI001B88DA39|nr:uncharacterized protein LOC121374798 [Gigantopelta aegis]